MKLTVGVVSYIEALDPTAAYLSVRLTNTTTPDIFMEDISNTTTYIALSVILAVSMAFIWQDRPLQLKHILLSGTVTLMVLVGVFGVSRGTFALYAKTICPLLMVGSVTVWLRYDRWFNAPLRKGSLTNGVADGQEDRSLPKR